MTPSPARQRPWLPTQALIKPLMASAPLALGAVLLGWSTTPPVRAHAIESSLDHLSRQTERFATESFAAELELNSRFSTGEPVDAASVRLLPPEGPGIELGHTDADGRLRFALPDDAAADWELQVDAGPGHRDYLELAEAGAMPPLAASPRPPAALRRTALGRLLAHRPGGVQQPLLGSLAKGGVMVGLGAGGALLLARRRRQ
jgi:nickel transport protein